MLESQLAADPAARLRGSTRARRPTASGDVTEGWIDFETAAGRGYGHIRLKDGLIWTLLTTLTELKGFEEPNGPTPADGRGARRTARTARPGRRSARRRRRSSATRRSPTC